MVHSSCSLLLQVMACCLIMMPEHLPSQFLNWTQRNKCHSNLNQDIALFVHENSFENVCKLMFISFKPQCVYSLRPLDPYRHLIGNLAIIGSDNGLSPGQCQAIIWTSAGILLIGLLGTNVREILIESHTFSLKQIHLKMSSAKSWLFCPDLNVLSSTLHFWWITL